jgi:hypothetical protein
MLHLFNELDCLWVAVYRLQVKDQLQQTITQGPLYTLIAIDQVGYQIHCYRNITGIEREASLVKSPGL